MTIVPAIRSPPRMRSRLIAGKAAKNNSHTAVDSCTPVDTAADGSAALQQHAQWNEHFDFARQISRDHRGG